MIVVASVDVVYDIIVVYSSCVIINVERRFSQCCCFSKAVLRVMSFSEEMSFTWQRGWWPGASCFVVVVSIQNGFWRRPHLTQSISQLSYFLQLVSLFSSQIYIKEYLFIYLNKWKNSFDNYASSFMHLPRSFDLLYQGMIFLVKISRFA